MLHMLYWSHRTMGQLITRIQQNSTLGSLIWFSWSHRSEPLPIATGKWLVILFERCDSSWKCYPMPKTQWKGGWSGVGWVLLGSFYQVFSVCATDFQENWRLILETERKKTPCPTVHFKSYFHFSGEWPVLRKAVSYT